MALLIAIDGARRHRRWQMTIATIGTMSALLWYWREMARFYETRVGELYAGGCAPDVLVEERASSYRERGIEDQRRGAEDSVAAGVACRSPTSGRAAP